jgi:hypothetical protein
MKEYTIYERNQMTTTAPTEKTAVRQLKTLGKIGLAIGGVIILVWLKKSSHPTCVAV